MPCNTPLKIRNKSPEGYSHHHVPCGKCQQCRLKRVKNWIHRLENEANIHTHGLFITLTYENPPLSKKGLPTLDKSHFQKFVKRLRKKTNYAHKYYAVGEYGSTTYRPHYHAILFGATHQEVNDAWVGYKDEQEGGNNVVNGHIYIGDVNNNSIAYTAKYIDKGKLIPLFSGDDRLPEFSLMSKKMGLNFLTPQMVKYYKKTQNPVYKQYEYVNPLCRYYKEKIFTKDELKIQNLKFEKLQKEKYDKKVLEHGTEIEYIRSHHANLWQQQVNYKLQNKLNRNKL